MTNDHFLSQGNLEIDENILMLYFSICLATTFCEYYEYKRMRLTTGFYGIMIAFFDILTGLQLQVDKFFIYFLLINLTNFAAISIAFCISAAVKLASVANMLVTLSYIIAIVSNS